MSTRKIIHVDMDCFYAAVEMRDNPELVGKPVAVGGSADGRGVLCTANYEARKFGLRSAMATATALRRCPDLILTPVNMSKYREVSQGIQAIFADYTEVIEPLSLDEAFLDVSGSAHQQGSASLIAAEIRQRIWDEHQLTASAGISVNKFIAKVASDWHKPNGQKVVPPEEVDEFVRVLPVGKIFGVGKVTEKKLLKHGVKTCGDLRRFSDAELTQHFGRFGERLYQLCRGIDRRQVKPDRIRKSMSVERTFEQDQPSLLYLQGYINGLLEELGRRYARKKSRYAISGVVLKLKFSDFQQTTVSHSGHYFWDADLLKREFHDLLEQAWSRGNRPVRLLGLGLQVTEGEAAPQYDLPI